MGFWKCELVCLWNLYLLFNLFFSSYLPLFNFDVILCFILIFYLHVYLLAPKNLLFSNEREKRGESVS